jgi:hypothetical protein
MRSSAVFVVVLLIGGACAGENDSAGESPSEATSTTRAPSFEHTAAVTEDSVRALCEDAQLAADLGDALGEPMSLRYPQVDEASNHVRCAFEGGRKADSPSAGQGAPLQVFADFAQLSPEESVRAAAATQGIEGPNLEPVEGLPGTAFYQADSDTFEGLVLWLAEGGRVGATVMDDGRTLPLEPHLAAADVWLKGLGVGRA